MLPSGRTSWPGVDMARAEAIRRTAPSEEIRGDQRDGEYFRWAAFPRGVVASPTY